MTTVTDDVINTSEELGSLGVLGVVILILVALLWITIRNSAKVSSVNNAVNNIKPGDTNLVDRVRNIESMLMKLDTWMDDFNRHGWPSLPADIGSAAALTETIRAIQNRIEVLHATDDEQRKCLESVLKELREVHSELAGHVEWEMSTKYGVHGWDQG